MALREVQVINHGTKDFVDRHHGITYVFKPNEKVLIPVAAAKHIFGSSEDNHRSAWIRQGHRNEKDGLAFVNQFELEVVNMVSDADVEAIKDENETLKARIAELEGGGAEPEKGKDPEHPVQKEKKKK